MRVTPLAVPVLLAALALGAVAVVPASAATAPVDLGTAAAFGVLGASTVTNTGPTLVSGDLGLSPGTAVTGFPPGQVTGVMHVADAVALQAQSDTTTAYNSAAGRPSDVTVSADLAGQTLLPGVYSGATLALNGTLTLDGANDPDAVFVFQAGSSLITGPGSSVVLVRGASACNVFWQVGSSATLGVGTTFQGTVAALASITAQTTAQVTGRLLARTGAVTMDTNTVRRPVCALAAAPTQPSTSPPSPVASPSSAAPAPSEPPSPAPSPVSSPVSSPASSAAPAPSASASGAPAPGAPAPATSSSPAAPAPSASSGPAPSAPAGDVPGPATSPSPAAPPLLGSPSGPQTPAPDQRITGTSISGSTQGGPSLPDTGSRAEQAAQLGLLALLIGALLTWAGRRPRTATC